MRKHERAQQQKAHSLRKLKLEEMEVDATDMPQPSSPFDSELLRKKAKKNQIGQSADERNPENLFEQIQELKSGLQREDQKLGDLQKQIECLRD